MAKGKTDAAGLYYELSAENIEGGQMLADLTHEIRRVATGLQAHWDRTKSRTGAGQVVLKINIKPSKDSEGYAKITTDIATKLPARGASTLAVAANGRLLVQPTGSSDKDPTQQLFVFNKRGETAGVLDPTSGEIADPPDIAGRVGAGAAG